MGRGYRLICSSYYILSPWCDEINCCCFICVTQWWILHVVIKRQFFTFYICCFSISIRSWDTTTSAFRKQTNVIWKFYIRFRFWTFYRHLYVIMQGRNKFCLNWTITERVMTLCRFFKMAEIFFCFLTSRGFTPLGRQRTICVLNFDKISLSTAKLLLLLVAEDRRQPYLNSTPGFDE